jgi:hypothetical protein
MRRDVPAISAESAAGLSKWRSERLSARAASLMLLVPRREWLAINSIVHSGPVAAPFITPIASGRCAVGRNAKNLQTGQFSR